MHPTEITIELENISSKILHLRKRERFLIDEYIKDYALKPGTKAKLKAAPDCSFEIGETMFIKEVTGMSSNRLYINYRLCRPNPKGDCPSKQDDDSHSACYSFNEEDFEVISD